MPGHVVSHTQLTDLEEIFRLFDYSVHYQEQRGYPVWRDYDKSAIVRDIDTGNQFKVLIGKETGIVFSVCYSDKVIWRERERGDAIYLHRIVVNPAHKGLKLFGVILDWVIQHAQQRKLQHIRMDTWAANPNIIAYYKTFGFSFVEKFTTSNSPELPIHNRNLDLVLLEYSLKNDYSKSTLSI